MAREGLPKRHRDLVDRAGWPSSAAPVDPSGEAFRTPLVYIAGMRWLDRLPWSLVLLLCLTLGLAPFAPPHLWEKLRMLAAGRLSEPVDWLDLLFHGAPWLLLAAKAVRGAARRER